MAPNTAARPPLPLKRRKEIFLALVDAQDHAMTVDQSRSFVTGRFAISEPQLREIEREGMDMGWPPL